MVCSSPPSRACPRRSSSMRCCCSTARFVKKDVQRRLCADAGRRRSRQSCSPSSISRSCSSTASPARPAWRRRSPTTSAPPKAGLADAQYAMAQIYANGVGGKKRDEVEARRWLTLAARQNFDTAQLDLGTWMVEGRGGAERPQGRFRLAEARRARRQCRRAEPGGQALHAGASASSPTRSWRAAWYFLARRAGLNDPEMDDFLRRPDRRRDKAGASRRPTGCAEGSVASATTARRSGASLASCRRFVVMGAPKSADRQKILFRKHDHGQDQRQRNPSRQRHRA